MPKVLLVETNCPNEAAAEKLAEAVHEARLAAAVNICAPISSLYRWQGEARFRPEVSVIFRTRPKLRAAIFALIRELHPYHTPGIVARKAEADADYAAWVKRETDPDPQEL